LIHAEVRIVDDVVENVPRGPGVGIEQRLGGDAVCQHEDDAQQYEEHEVSNLSNTACNAIETRRTANRYRERYAYLYIMLHVGYAYSSSWWKKINCLHQSLKKLYNLFKNRTSMKR